MGYIQLTPLNITFGLDPWAGYALFNHGGLFNSLPRPFSVLLLTWIPANWLCGYRLRNCISSLWLLYFGIIFLTNGAKRLPKSATRSFYLVDTSVSQHATLDAAGDVNSEWRIRRNVIYDL